MAGAVLDHTTGIEDLITAAEAAALCGVKVQAVTNWVARGHLKAAGLDDRNRKLYKVIDVAKAERATRDHPASRNRWD